MSGESGDGVGGASTDSGVKVWGVPEVCENCTMSGESGVGGEGTDSGVEVWGVLDEIAASS